MLQVNQLVGFGAGGGIPGPVAVAYQSDHSATGVGTTTLTFTSVGFGAAVAGRRVYIALTAEDPNAVVIAMTIGGATATQHQFSAASGGSTISVEIWSALLEAGTSGDVVVTTDLSTSTTWRLSSYQVTGVNFPAVSTAANSGSTTALLTTIDVPVGGALIAAQVRATDTQTLTWTGATENSDVDAGTHRHSAASANVLAGEAGRAVTGTGSASGLCAQCAVSIG